MIASLILNGADRAALDDQRRGLATRCPKRRRNQRFCSFVGCGDFRRRRGIRGGHFQQVAAELRVTSQG